ncbi:gamma-glutamyl-gamma-aminobutyrate hydrolase family protein [Caldimonas sp. KR1-144]|uniref:gamma-glutamyl-gamma-aminobutyrate hydrolase family protein n=1 Tax=Caldimonas sp. KR1-144 TaxID=3400911 RepID=UPI003C0B8BB5
MNALASSPSPARPVVLVPACNRQIGHHPYHVAGQKYIDAVRLAGCLPLVVPSAQAHEIDELLDLADGVFLTGSPSNVHPRHFDEVVRDPSLPLDTLRDDWTLPLIPRAIERGIPLFAICRGFQEANVALGGALHQAVQEQPGLMDHRAKEDAPVEEQYGFAHAVHVEPGGLLETLLGSTEFQVNSVHGQGIKRLANGLRVEARAPDGLVEAFSLPDAPNFNLAVQWHPEWQARSNPISVKLLRAFGDACRTFRERNRETVRERPRVP